MAVGTKSLTSAKIFHSNAFPNTSATGLPPAKPNFALMRGTTYCKIHFCLDFLYYLQYGYNEYQEYYSP